MKHPSVWICLLFIAVSQVCVSMNLSASEDLQGLFRNNEQWILEQTTRTPTFFKDLANAQRPGYFWLGCSDSRVPSNDIVGLTAGDLFVHRNIANMFVHTDLSALSVLEYAVVKLEIPHIIVCGHTECGGVKAAMSSNSIELIDNWILNIRDVYVAHQQELDKITDLTAR